MRKFKTIHIFALAAHGKGLSGGDRIFIELARRWSKKISSSVYLWEEGYEMCCRQNLQISNIKFLISKLNKWCKFGFIICYLVRIIEGIRLGLTVKVENKTTVYIYNASEFWMDLFPCVLLKIRYPKIKWVASWYQTAPNPLRGYQEQGTPLRQGYEGQASLRQPACRQGRGLVGQARKRKYFFSAFLYWLSQLPVKPLVKKYADKVIVNNAEEKKQFPEFTQRGDAVVLIGAVPLNSIKEWKSRRVKINKVYGAVFQGRFHPQKGVVELIDIWKKVVEKIPNAKLAMIGDGPLMKNVKSQILNYKLENNIKLFGYVFDGPKKYMIFSQSKLVVHPAYYDSGGMATAEAMAFGLPAVGFNLIAYASYYPKGMIKAKDEEEFSRTIIRLLGNSKLRNKIGQDAQDLIYQSYSWDYRAKEIFTHITK